MGRKFQAIDPGRVQRVARVGHGIIDMSLTRLTCN